MTQNLSEEQLKKKRRENLLDDATKELNEWTGMIMRLRSIYSGCFRKSLNVMIKIKRMRYLLLALKRRRQV